MGSQIRFCQSRQDELLLARRIAKHTDVRYLPKWMSKGMARPAPLDRELPAEFLLFPADMAPEVVRHLAEVGGSQGMFTVHPMTGLYLEWSRNVYGGDSPIGRIYMDTSGPAVPGKKRIAALMRKIRADVAGTYPALLRGGSGIFVGPDACSRHRRDRNIRWPNGSIAELERNPKFLGDLSWPRDPDTPRRS